MRHALLILLLPFGLTALAQDNVQLTQVPPKPTCTLIFNTGTCADLWRAYNQALAKRQREEIQLYVNRQKELASSAATAPLQQQIADLNRLVSDQQSQIKKQQDQMQADAAAALQAATQARDANANTLLQEKSSAHRQGLWQGSAIGAGAMLLLFFLIRFSRSFTITKKSQVTAA
jgi:hypothetical protein